VRAFFCEKGNDMWKLVMGFVVFAAAALWMLSKGGDIDMGGEKHEINVPHPPEAAASVATPAKSASTP
jgi:hypothetical protein